MKSRLFLPPLPVGLGTGRRLAWRGLLAMLCAGGLANGVRAQATELDVGVRSTLVDKPFGKSGMQNAPKHGKVYAILSVDMIKSQDKLVKPVDATRLAGLAVQQLDAHGFSRVVRGKKPDILITLLYGRGWLHNPYLAGAGVETPGGEGSVVGIDAPTVTITGIPSQLFKEKENGFEAKLQKAQYEKLCIRVTAWKYPTDAKAKPIQLWHTTMIVDDPDHRDLNSVAAEMFAAGAPYFDKEIKEEEIDVNTTREGHVNVGMPEVVDPMKSREK